MNLGKETILVGIAGFALGLVAAWAVWTLPQIVSKKESSVIIQKPVASSLLSPSFFLQVDKPVNDSISSTNELTVSGKTLSGTTIVISSVNDDQVMEASGDGQFNLPVNLEEGSNEIVITAYSPSGNEEKNETRIVNYTAEEF